MLLENGRRRETVGLGGANPLAGVWRPVLPQIGGPPGEPARTSVPRRLLLAPMIPPHRPTPHDAETDPSPTPQAGHPRRVGPESLAMPGHGRGL
jgi:hypothetical protein